MLSFMSSSRLGSHFGFLSLSTNMALHPCISKDTLL
jgi:hypothetical protein